MGEHPQLTPTLVTPLSTAVVQSYRAHSCTRAVLKFPDTRSRNRRNSWPKFDARLRSQFFRADARVLTSLTAFGALKAVNDVRSRASAPTARENGLRNLASNLWRRFLERVSVA